VVGRLERGSHRELQKLPADSAEHMLHEAESGHLRDLDAEWSKILGEIRAKHEFRDFLRPKSLSVLKSAAANVNGSIVILNVNTAMSEGSFGAALIVTAAADVQFVPLRDIDIVSAAFLAGLLRSLPRSTYLISDLAGSKLKLHNFLKTWKSEQRSNLQARLTGKIVYEGIGPNDAFGLILAELWKAIVKPVICALKLEVIHTLLFVCFAVLTG
jgi:hypothetical protein